MLLIIHIAVKQSIVTLEGITQNIQISTLFTQLSTQRLISILQVINVCSEQSTWSKWDVTADSCLVGPSREPISHQLVCLPAVRQVPHGNSFWNHHRTLPCSESMMQAAWLKCSECLGTWLLLGSQGSNICSCLVGPSREPISHQLLCWPAVRQSTDDGCFQYAPCNRIM